MTYRDRFSDALKTAMKAKDQRTVSTVRLVLAKLKDLDIAARPKGEGVIPDAEIERMLQSMIKQRRESADLYDQGNRPELAQNERQEIAIIEGFLPQQMGASEVEAAVTALITELGLSSGPKGMGPLMAALRERFAGRMDFAQASAVAKKALTSA